MPVPEPAQNSRRTCDGATPFQATGCLTDHLKSLSEAPGQKERVSPLHGVSAVYRSISTFDATSLGSAVPCVSKQPNHSYHAQSSRDGTIRTDASRTVSVV